MGSHFFPFGVHSLMGVTYRKAGRECVDMVLSQPLAAASPASQPTTQPCREPFTITRPCTSAPATTSFHQSSVFDDRCRFLLSICADGAGRGGLGVKDFAEKESHLGAGPGHQSSAVGQYGPWLSCPPPSMLRGCPGLGGSNTGLYLSFNPSFEADLSRALSQVLCLLGASLG